MPLLARLFSLGHPEGPPYLAIPLETPKVTLDTAKQQMNNLPDGLALRGAGGENASEASQPGPPWPSERAGTVDATPALISRQLQSPLPPDQSLLTGKW